MVILDRIFGILNLFEAKEAWDRLPFEALRPSRPVMQELTQENGLSQSDGLKLSHFRIIRISIKWIYRVCFWAALNAVFDIFTKYRSRRTHGKNFRSIGSFLVTLRIYLLFLGLLGILTKMSIVTLFLDRFERGFQ